MHPLRFIRSASSFRISAASCAATASVFAFAAASAQAQTSPNPWRVTVDAGKPGAMIEPNFYGLMTEEINYAYDADFTANWCGTARSATTPNTPVFWSPVEEDGGTASMSLDKTNGVNAALNASLKVTATTTGGRAGVANAGYWGIPVRPRTTYALRFM